MSPIQYGTPARALRPTQNTPLLRPFAPAQNRFAGMPLANNGQIPDAAFGTLNSQTTGVIPDAAFGTLPSQLQDTARRGGGGAAPAYLAPRMTTFNMPMLPPRRGIGTGGEPQAWSTPQQNFEDAMDRGQLTPDKLAAAQAFAAANGRVFDPRLGYSTNRMPTAPAGLPMQPALPAPAPTPAAPTATPKPTPFMGPMQPRDNDPTLSLRLDQERFYKQPRTSFATGTFPGERTPTDRPFTINERPGQQEVMTLPDGTQVIPPPGPRTVMSPAPMQVLPTFAPSGNAPAPMPMPATQPAFLPSFDPTLRAPQGVRETDFRRFMGTPEGLKFALSREAQAEGMAAQNQSRMAYANTQRQWEMQDAALRNLPQPAPMPANAPSVVPEGFMPVPKAFLPSGQVQSWGLEPKLKTEAPTDVTPRFVPLPGTGYGMAFAGERPMGTLPMQQQTPQSDEDLMAEAYRVDTPEELRSLMGKTRNLKVITEARKRLDSMTSTSTPTDEVYWDAINSKMVKIPAGYEPPPELGLKRLARKGEAMPAPGANAGAAPSKLDVGSSLARLLGTNSD
jgi:hypothetical protein